LRFIELKTPTYHGLVRRENNRWQLVSPPEHCLLLALVRTTADKLCDLYALSYVTAEAGRLGAYGLDKPQLTVRFGFLNQQGKTQQLELQIGDLTEGGHYYARLGESEEIFILGRSVVDTLRTPFSRKKR
jgi:hypothetical protein